MNENKIVVNAIITLSKSDPKFIQICRKLAGSIECEDYTITDLVMDLGTLLTSTSLDEREKGTLILSSVLPYIPEHVLSATQLRVICNFYTDRLNENHKVVPAVIHGLTPLIGFKNIPIGLSTQLLRSLLQYVSCQQQQQVDRYNIYNFIKTLLDKRKQEMKSFGLDLVYGVISLIDGERDPRNLLFLFNWLPTFLQIIDLGHLTEETFEVICCYFPVDFRSATQDENSITRDTLACALRPCLCAIPAFGDFCIPLVLEKLPSGLHTAKLDSLDLLIEGCKIFPVDAFKKHSTAIWSLLQKEVFNCEDKYLEDKCLLTLTLVLKKISEDGQYSNQIVEDIIDTIKGNLRPDAGLFIASSKLLKSIADSSGRNAELVFNKTSSVFLNTYNITATTSHKSTILQELINITVMYLSLNNTATLDDNDNLKIIPTICLKAMTDINSEVRSVGVHGLSRLAKFVTPSIRHYFYQNLLTLLVLKQEKIVRTSLIESLIIFAKLYPNEIQHLLEGIQINGSESSKLYLEAIGSVVFLNEFKSFSLCILIANVLKTFDVSMIAIEILRKIMEEDEVSVSEYLVNVQDIFGKMVDYVIKNFENFNIEYHAIFLNNIAKVLDITIRNLKEDAQELIIKKHLKKLVSLPRASDINIVICYGLLNSLKPNVNIPMDVIKQIFDITFTTKSSYISNTGSQLCANIINKKKNETTLPVLLKYIESKCDNLLSINQQIDNVLKVMAFTTKALIVMNNSHGNVWVHKLLLFSANNLQAAQAFQVILDDNYECLSTRSFCNKTLLYKQKFFSEMTTFLVDNFGESKEYYLTILGYMLSKVPQQIIAIELKKIIRLILLCLSHCKEPDVLEAVLSTINIVIENKDPLAADYIQEFLTYFLKLTSFSRSMKIRILALKGIQLYSQYPLYKSLPVKQEILMVLGKCLDDKKRLVRKEAVDARSKWYLIGAPI